MKHERSTLGSPFGGHNWSRKLLVSLALSMTLAVSACTSEAPPPNDGPSINAPAMPMPQGVHIFPPGSYHPTTSLENPYTCNAYASLRPLNPMPKPGMMPAHGQLHDIAQRGRLIVGIDISSNPFSFRDPVSGDIEGFDIDIAHAISQAMFGDPNKIEYRIIGSDERVDAVQRNDVDLIIKTMSVTCDRNSNILFSTVYYDSDQRIMVDKTSDISSIKDLSHKRICVARGSTSLDRIATVAPQATLVTTSSWADCLVLLQQGQTDAVSADEGILAGLKTQDPNTEIIGPVLGYERYAIAANKHSTELIRFVNGVLENLRTSGQWQRIYDRWLNNLGYVGSPPAPDYRD